jgi:PAS domain S-box-containing protein
LIRASHFKKGLSSEGARSSPRDRIALNVFLATADTTERGGSSFEDLAVMQAILLLAVLTVTVLVLAGALSVAVNALGKRTHQTPAADTPTNRSNRQELGRDNPLPEAPSPSPEVQAEEQTRDRVAPDRCEVAPPSSAAPPIDARPSSRTESPGPFSFGDLADLSRDMVLIATNPEGRIMSMNRGSEILLGYEADQVCGQMGVEKLFRQEELEVLANIRKASAGRPIHLFESLVIDCAHGATEEQLWTWIASDGTALSVSLTITALKDDRNAVQGFLFLARPGGEPHVPDASTYTSEPEPERPPVPVSM